ncbi:hypothetical protein NIES2135_64600 (plasmid) [Leptolyngbya boryana NIES-2135]|jgi:hypothetical protein|uniref:Cyanobacterial TRADD-N associated 2 transmembrane domain-containing protein n=1 Tax=Leptolyngbya boryana NIES-2135 TaxID=1973484 RepID=A0A1Z4JSD8_LEPBY|nr:MULTISPECIES: hypothetical protein [Leptolyngbya]BAY59583.1 hypothetical protein NIES2135_64600 [Leptolyngbya boryana NIES-2135]MBD2371156.1 hypothetical protein [Leptolyngbya sp. FACHB-161]MBD2377624.1 hypothetical protein [Leptolyngbya sp. FACHB-238]MBD2402046.1 hypothetical protein [Leptolyngbya sp. FACHB-239]MBD2408565.1 hypothetical protein [Leptolyngbya sp. FACHB-402]
MENPHDVHTQSSLSHQIAEEILRQSHITFNSAHRSFQAALIMTGASALISIAGVGLLLTERTSEGAISTASGLVSGSRFLTLKNEAEKRLQDANDRLDKILATLSDAE